MFQNIIVELARPTSFEFPDAGWKYPGIVPIIVTNKTDQTSSRSDRRWIQSQSWKAVRRQHVKNDDQSSENTDDESLADLDKMSVDSSEIECIALSDSDDDEVETLEVLLLL